MKKNCFFGTPGTPPAFSAALAAMFTLAVLSLTGCEQPAGIVPPERAPGAAQTA